jgi:prophage antirepressor-like protein
MQVLLFKYEEENHFNDFRTVEIDGEIWFVAADVAAVLGYKRPSEAVRQHCKEKGTVKRRIPGLGGEQEMLLINEPNVYRLIARSNLPSAERFEEWLFEEVVPSIRKTGTYTVGIDRLEKPNFVTRYFANFDHVDQGYFSVINELYIRLYARLEHAGYKIPNRAANGQEMRPDVSVGKCFSVWLKKNYPEIANDFMWYKHEFPGTEIVVDAKQYPNKYMHYFIQFVDEVWVPNNAERYFRERDLKALDYLPKLLPKAA